MTHMRANPWLLTVLLSLLTSACAHVAPYDREALSRPSMNPATETGEAAFQAHMHEARAGATSGAGAAGGGCGCN